MNGLEAITKAHELKTRYKRPDHATWWKITYNPTFTHHDLMRDGWEVETPLREYWINVCDDGECKCLYSNEKDAAVSLRNPNCILCKTIHVREVKD